ncbi:MAG: rRNA maturation RNase YbeY [Caldicoprobacterales bacterium]|nr:rRNA maturation RNase YbeY [Clostridiales bacterium]
MKIDKDVIIEIDNRQDRINITRETEKLIYDCVKKVLDMEEFHLKALVDITLVDNHYIKEINLEYRGIDDATDVLSFPMLNLKAGQKDIDVQLFINDTDPDTGAIILGDIIVSMERVKEQAEEYGHSFERELGFLIVHGMLHLLGYDHIEKNDRDLMRSREETVLEALNLTRY